MSLKEQTIILTDKDSQGNTIMQFPITKAKNIEDVMSIAQGGTGQTTASGVRNALGLGNTTGALPIANGGTGATTAQQACINLGAIGYRSSIGSIKSIKGSFWADSNSGINMAELPSIASEVDYWFLQLGMKSGHDKMQIFCSGQEMYMRYAGADNGSEDWTQSSWKLWPGKGIVAQSLGRNGYVKFANGYTFQWGIENAGFSNPIKFPISFSTVYAVVGIESSDRTRSCAMHNPTATGFNAILSARDGFYWMAAGVIN